jgi:hypothetical protein
VISDDQHANQRLAWQKCDPLDFFLVRKARNTALCADTDAQLAEPADTLFRYFVLPIS